MKKFLPTLVVLFSFVGLVSAPVYAATNPLFNEVCNGSGGPSTSDTTVCKQNKLEDDQSNSFYGKDGIITKAARILALIVGIASVVMIIIGGFKYVLSNGDSNAINSAKNTIIYAIIGLIVSVIAGTIVQFVLTRV